MSRITRRAFLATSAAAAAGPVTKPRPLRSESFFGLHFDLHPNKDDKVLGRDVTEEMVDNLILRVHPDFIQYDCKGHPGYLGYPSTVGPSAPGIVKDSLAIYRKVTASRGVALYIHFSGVWDYAACEQHPEWARVAPDGTPDKRQTSTFGAYVDLREIPQLDEAATKYDLDGAWIDGECWATNPDYCAAAKKAFGEPLPGSPKDPRWLDFLEFNREQFRKYVAHYVDVLHGKHPRFQIASNWMYSTYMPEAPRIPVDFVSGDYLGNAAIETARLEARYLAGIGKPWDLMAWGFASGRNNAAGIIHKPAVQLQQEASVVLAQGGGFQIYYTPTRAGWIDNKLIGVMASVGKFCRDRQLSHRSTLVPHVGLLFSKHSLYTTSNKLFGGWPANLTAPAHGLLSALLENHYNVDVIPCWKLEHVSREYPVIAVPSWRDVGTRVRDLLREYLRGGGRLLLVGSENASLFTGELGVTLAGETKDEQTFILGEELLGSVKGAWLDVNSSGAEVVEPRYASVDTTKPAKPAATLHKSEKGIAAAIYGPVDAEFAVSHAPAIRQFIGRVMRRLWTPPLRIDAPPTIEVVLRRKDNQLCLHLLNSTAMQVSADYPAIDYIPPAGPVRIELDLPAQPKRVRLRPGGSAVGGTWRNARWSAVIDSVPLHSILVFD